MLCLLLLGATSAHAQELNCNVIVNDERVQTQERQIFQEMQQAIQQFMNTTKWTDHEYQEHEKIKCNILITFKQNSTLTNFSADVQIQSLRPVYGTDYETPLFNFVDKENVVAVVLNNAQQSYFSIGANKVYYHIRKPDGVLQEYALVVPYQEEVLLISKDKLQDGNKLAVFYNGYYAEFGN